MTTFAAAAELERGLNRERVRAALDVKRRSGERTGAIPYGFRLDRERLNDQGKPFALVPDESEQSVIVQIQTWSAAGWNPRRIAERLTATGIPTKENAPVESVGAAA